MKRILFIIVLIASPVIAADPPKVVTTEPPLASTSVIDKLIADLADIRGKKADIAKQESDKLAAIQTESARIAKLLADAGIQPPAPPTPPDPFTSDVIANYEADKGRDKANLAYNLLVVFKTAQAASATDIPSTADLVAKLRAGRIASNITDTDLVNLRHVIDAGLANALGTPSTLPMSDATRAAVTAQLTATVNALNKALGK